jgi:hypothetical protein
MDEHEIELGQGGTGAEHKREEGRRAEEKRAGERRGKAGAAMADTSVEDRVRTAQVEARARHISHNVRCLECGHQSIEESAADIAVRLRKVLISLPIPMYSFFSPLFSSPFR